MQYVCVAPDNQGLHPGKTVAGNCNIGWGGKEIIIGIPPAFYVAYPFRVVWVSSSPGQPLPARAIKLGFEADGTTLYSCRAPYNGGVHLGKVVKGNCNFGWGGSEIVVPSYDVLVAR